MVIAKPEWFKKRKGGFWNCEMKWQGVLYLMITFSLIFIGMILPQTLWNGVIILAMFLFLFMDGLLASVKALDEREQMQYAISMRNASWGMIVALIVLLTLVSNFNVTKHDLYILIMLSIMVGGLVGVITRYKLQREC